MPHFKASHIFELFRMWKIILVTLPLIESHKTIQHCNVNSAIFYSRLKGCFPFSFKGLLLKLFFLFPTSLSVHSALKKAFLYQQTFLAWVVISSCYCLNLDILQYFAKKNNTRQESSMIHSASPQSRPAVIVALF